MANVVKRLNYFDHQFLRAPDFNDEQNYHLTMRRYHNQMLHTPGIVQGLVPSAQAGATTVTVSSGFAIDGMGREMLLPGDVQLDLTNEAAGKTVYFTIEYNEQQSDPSADAGATGNTRWTESPKVSFAEQPPAVDSMALVLGQVSRTATGLGPIDLSARKSAGVVVSGDLKVNSLSLKRDGVDPATWPNFSCSGPNQAVATGSLGIGTAAPNRNLSVSGQGDTTGVYANVKNDKQELLIGVDSVAIVSAMTATDLHIRTNNATRIVVAQGDGNTRVQNTLTAGPFAMPTAEGRLAVTGASAELSFTRRNLSAWPAAPAAGDRFVWYNPDGTARLYTEKTGDLLTVDAKGFVGLGTTPGFKLDVAERMRVRQGGTPSAGIWFFQTAANGDRAFVGMANDNSVGFWGNTGVGWGVQMDTSNGNLTTRSVFLANSDLYFTKTDHNHTGFGNTAGYAAIENAANYNALMILGRTISTNPLVRLVKMWDQFEMNGNALKPGGGAWGALSDLRLKKNVSSLEGALDRLLSLRGVEFEWKDPEKAGNLTGLQVGLVAQEVEEVFPEWIGNDSDGFKTVSVRGFEALVIEALRELKSDVAALQKQVSAISPEAVGANESDKPVAPTADASAKARKAPMRRSDSGAKKD
ncbi:MAG TPA: tail fiber domain-containing protein [Candidatus Eisenbacteria bacterium]|nr:tail fiber domain-containing protein [Candidatus Eisenbacteria bacterium]